MSRTAALWLAAFVLTLIACGDGHAPATRDAAALPVSAESVHVELGACPFECCQYGRWRADSTVALYSRRDTTSENLGEVRRGTIVNARTGAVHVRPGRLVLHDSIGSRFRPGDTLSIHSYVGEGHWRVRRAGTRDSLVDAPLRSIDAACVGSTPGPRCDGQLLYAPAQVWWARVERADGLTGWTPRADLFAGADACGVYDPPIEPPPA
jgi:hypothetical protein